MKSCEQYQEEISAMLDGALSAEERASLRAHIAACPECRQVYDAFRSIQTELSALRPAPDGLATSVMRQIKKPKAARWRRYLAMAACFVLVGAAALRLAGGPLGGGNAAAPLGLSSDKAVGASSAQSAGAAAESAEEKVYALEAPAAAPADPMPAHTAEAGGGETRMSVCAAVNGGAELDADSLLADLADADAGTPAVPDRAPDRTVALPAGLLEVWTEGETMVCRLGEHVFFPADPAEIRALLEG